MSKKQRIAAFVLVLLVALLWALFLGREEIPVPVPTPSPSSVINVKPSPRPGPPGSESLLSKPYPFEEIERALATNRHRVANCFLRDREFRAPSVQMTIRWTPTAVLESIQLKPDPGQEIRQCLEEEIRSWRLRPHPGLQGFQYRVELRL